MRGQRIHQPSINMSVQKPLVIFDMATAMMETNREKKIE